MTFGWTLALSRTFPGKKMDFPLAPIEAEILFIDCTGFQSEGN